MQLEAPETPAKGKPREASLLTSMWGAVVDAVKSLVDENDSVIPITSITPSRVKKASAAQKFPQIRYTRSARSFDADSVSPVGFRISKNSLSSVG